MPAVLAVFVLLGLSCSIYSAPVTNVNGHMNQIRDALEHIHQVRSALRSSLEKRDADNNGRARSTVRELETVAEVKRDTAAIMSNAINAIRKRAEVAKRNIKLGKRNDEEKRVLRNTADNIKQAIDNNKVTRDQAEFEIRKGDERVLRNTADNIKQAIDNSKETRDQAEFQIREGDERVLRNTADNIKQAIDNNKETRDQAEFQIRGDERVLRNTADNIKQAIDNSKETRDQAEFQIREGDERVLRNTADNIRQAIDNSKETRDQAEASDVYRRFCSAIGVCRSEAFKEAKRSGEVLGKVGKAFDEFTKRHLEVRKQQNERFFRNTADNIKQAIDNINHKRDQAKASNLYRRFCSAIGICSPEVVDEAKRSQEGRKKNFDQSKTRSSNAQTVRDTVSKIREGINQFRKKSLRDTPTNSGSRLEAKGQENQRIVRVAASGVNAAVDAVQEKMKRRKQPILSVRHPMDSTFNGMPGHLQKKGSTPEEDSERNARFTEAIGFGGGSSNNWGSDHWKRKVREVLLKKAAQMKEAAKTDSYLQNYRAISGQV